MYWVHLGVICNRHSNQHGCFSTILVFNALIFFFCWWALAFLFLFSWQMRYVVMLDLLLLIILLQFFHCSSRLSFVMLHLLFCGAPLLLIILFVPIFFTYTYSGNTLMAFGHFMKYVHYLLDQRNFC